MTKAEKNKIKAMLDDAVRSYFVFAKRDDLDKPCVRREILARQNAAFTLADYLYKYDFISWEECCELWAKVGLTDDEASCKFTYCGGNINGKCKYVIEKGGAE